MKFKVGDQVLVTGGKDKGKKSVITAVFPQENKVTVAEANLYTKHMKPAQDRPGQKIRRERPLHTASISLMNDKGQPDRVGYEVAKDGSKTRVFKKTGKPVPQPKEATSTKKK
jgi:large subunit ribosomal protein L24